MPDSLIGQTLGQYEIRMLLGKGGMASVYLAYQPSMDRVVAIKVLPREFLHDDTFLTRFQREVRTIAGLEHLHILPVYDVGEDQGVPYLVMRYLSGGTLADRIEARLPDLPTVVRIITQIAGALDYAHERGIIHRDLKPSNVLLDNSGNAYLADFGIARIQEAASVTTGSHVLGTPAYIAPEMVRKGEEITASVDVYALGVLAYEMLTGEPPYYDPDPTKTLMAHVLEPVPSVRDFDPNISPAVDAVIERCLAKRPSQRTPSAGQFARELAHAAEAAYHSAPLYPPIGENAPPVPQPAPAWPASPVPPLRFAEEDEPRSRRRVSGGCLITLGVVAALIGGMVLAAFALADSNPLGLLNALTPGPTRTVTPTVTLTPAGGAAAPLPDAGTPPPPAPAAGGTLAFASNRDGNYDIYLIDLDGENLRRLTSHNAFDFDPDWSPDGTRIVFASTRDGDAEIMVMDADGANVEKLTDNNVRDTDPAWSPDGEWIAFSSERDGSFGIYIMRPDGSDVRQVTFSEADDLSPAWSPDSRQIAYYSREGQDSETADLFIIDREGGTPRRLTDNGAINQWPAWSPDGTRIAFSSTAGLGAGRRALFALDLATGQISRLTDGTARDDDPAWSPDGRLLAFDSDRGSSSSQFDLFVLDLESGQLRQLTSGRGSDVAPAWQPWP